MLKTILPAATLAAFCGGAAFADAFTDQAIAKFQDMGFDFIEVQDGISQLKIEGIKGTQQLEVVYDKSSGRILKQEQERADARDIGRTGVSVRQRNRNFVDAPSAPPSGTAVDTDGIVAELRAEGYDFIEIKRGPTQTKVEAIRGNRELEIVYDNETGQVLKRETGIADSSDVGRTGIEIDTEDRDFVGDRRRASRDDDDDNRGRGRGADDDDDDYDDNSGRGSGDDDDDDDDNSGSGSGGNDDDDDDNSGSGSSSSGSGSGASDDD